MLMENTLRLKDHHDLINLFDLKGSVVDRESPPEAGTLKDTNFKKMSSRQNLYTLTKQQAVKRYLELENDVSFLRGCGLMDYSLLVGVERNKKQTINNAMRKRSYLGDDL